MKRIAFFDTKSYDRRSFEAKIDSKEFEISFFEARLSPKTADLVKGFDGVCAFVNDTLDTRVIDILKRENIGVVAMRCAGYNNVDLKAAFNNVHFLRVPAYSPYAVAEHAAALILTLNRRTHKSYLRTRESNFALAGLEGFDLHGKTAGVIGTGKIGRIMIRILRGFGMDVLAHDPYPDQEYAQHEGFHFVDLDALYARSDIISLHCPLTKETHHLIDADALAAMKPGVMIINTSRGGLIDTKALVAGLKSGKIGYAGLDVYEEEGEYFFEDLSGEIISDDILARLLTFPNVLITSHQGFFTKEALANIAETTLGNFRAFFRGEALDNEVCYRCDRPECRKKREGRCF
ncbi:2-hydroxyacid dehydrogenase [Marispirochaeta sp.]|jgi:D-lactate dehydrogenase|uniref:2-hydroxyacid dehydrogenase n=1 Tax=Marispirochaeta sp. TaxID=2038653 RepID=UPI0029C96B4B|nr:2-hydroxyacid dehydrogenase [Marispirochaeta sp.]